MRPINEFEWQSTITSLARWLGFACYHTHDSRKSEPGFPDLILIKGKYLLAIELKVGRNQPTAEQDAWLKRFAGVRHVRAAVWRPEDRDQIIADLQEFSRTAYQDDERVG